MWLIYSIAAAPAHGLAAVIPRQSSFGQTEDVPATHIATFLFPAELEHKQLKTPTVYSKLDTTCKHLLMINKGCQNTSACEEKFTAVFET